MSTGLIKKHINVIIRLCHEDKKEKTYYAMTVETNVLVPLSKNNPSIFLTSHSDINFKISCLSTEYKLTT